MPPYTTTSQKPVIASLRLTLSNTEGAISTCVKQLQQLEDALQTFTDGRRCIASSIGYDSPPEDQERADNALLALSKIMPLVTDLAAQVEVIESTLARCRDIFDAMVVELDAAVIDDM